MSAEIDQESRKGIEELAQRALLGQRIQEFFGSEIGDYLNDRLDSDEDAAMFEFKNCDHNDTDKMKDVHFRVSVIDEIRRYLVEGNDDGIHARDEIERSLERDE